MAYDLQLFTNNAVTLLAAPISGSSTSLTVMPGYGALFPNPAPGQFFLVTLENQFASAREIIRVDARSGDTFTSIQRAQEGTTAASWTASAGSDTLVDHRVTAETMRRAMLLPEATGGSGGIAGITVQSEGITVSPDATTLNFIGNVSVVGTGSTKTINIGAADHEIHGTSSQVPKAIDPAWTQALTSTTYSQNQRGFKFFVTVTMPINGKSSTFEVLGNISGDIAAGTEAATWNRTARVGYNFLGSVNIVLNTTTKQIDLVWTNGEAYPVEVMCTRIQHIA